jgi:hypothetical protein
MQLLINPFTGPGTYSISQATPTGAATTVAVIARLVTGSEPDVPTLEPERYFAIAGGRIVVTGFDPFASRAVGTFDFDAADSSGAELRVRDGSFDVPLTDDPPPVSLRALPFPLTRP